jgi:D-methionine transport system substrate-binding protein
MKLFRAFSCFFAAAFAVNVYAAEVLTVAATPVPHAEILEFVKPMLAAEGVNLEVKVFTDYVQPNMQVAQGNIDANYFQHQPYLDEFNKSRGTKLETVCGVHIEPFGAYSRKLVALTDLKRRATIAIPSDPTNEGRALLLLNKYGVITLKDSANITATLRDIVKNPKRLKIRELEAATIPRVLDQVELALINTNYALDAGLNPMKDALIIEGGDSPYVNILVTRADNVNNAAIQKLAKALQSPETKKFIEEKYKGAVIPVF